MNYIVAKNKADGAFWRSQSFVDENEIESIKTNMSKNAEQVDITLDFSIMSQTDYETYIEGLQ